MFEPQQLSKQISRKVTFTFGSGIGVWLLLLLRGANDLRDKSILNHMYISIGSLHLSELTRTKVEDGFIVRLTLKPGLAIFLLSCLGAGLVWAYITYRLYCFAAEDTS